MELKIRRSHVFCDYRFRAPLGRRPNVHRYQHKPVSGESEWADKSLGAVANMDKGKLRYDELMTALATVGF